MPIDRFFQCDKLIVEWQIKWSVQDLVNWYGNTHKQKSQIVLVRLLRCGSRDPSKPSLKTSSDAGKSHRCIYCSSNIWSYVFSFTVIPSLEVRIRVHSCTFSDCTVNTKVGLSPIYLQNQSVKAHTQGSNVHQPVFLNKHEWNYVTSNSSSVYLRVYSPKKWKLIQVIVENSLTARKLFGWDTPRAWIVRTSSRDICPVSCQG